LKEEFRAASNAAKVTSLGPPPSLGWDICEKTFSTSSRDRPRRLCRQALRKSSRLSPEAPGGTKCEKDRRTPSGCPQTRRAILCKNIDNCFGAMRPGAAGSNAMGQSFVQNWVKDIDSAVASPATAPQSCDSKFWGISGVCTAASCWKSCQVIVDLPDLQALAKRASAALDD